MIRNLIAIALLLLATSASAGSWYDDYEKGVRLIEQGQGDAAKSPLVERTTNYTVSTGLAYRF